MRKINILEAFAVKTRVWSVRLSVLAVVAAFLGLSVLPTDAEARRLGGGGSFGRSAPSQFQKSPSTAPSGTTSTAPSKQQATNPAGTTAGTAAAPRNRFLGPLGGLAAGLGLAALFSHLGFGAGMAEFLGTLLMIGAAVFAVMMSLIGAFYYLRVVKVMYFDEPLTAATVSADLDVRVVLSLNGLLVLVLGIVPGALMALCADAVVRMLAA